MNITVDEAYQDEINKRLYEYKVANDIVSEHYNYVVRSFRLYIVAKFLEYVLATVFILFLFISYVFSFDISNLELSKIKYFGIGYIIFMFSLLLLLSTVNVPNFILKFNKDINKKFADNNIFIDNITITKKLFKPPNLSYKPFDVAIHSQYRFVVSELAKKQNSLYNNVMSGGNDAK